MVVWCLSLAYVCVTVDTPDRIAPSSVVPNNAAQIANSNVPLIALSTVTTLPVLARTTNWSICVLVLMAPRVMSLVLRDSGVKIASAGVTASTLSTPMSVTHAVEGVTVCPDSLASGVTNHVPLDTSEKIVCYSATAKTAACVMPTPLVSANPASLAPSAKHNVTPPILVWTAPKNASVRMMESATRSLGLVRAQMASMAVCVNRCAQVGGMGPTVGMYVNVKMAGLVIEMGLVNVHLEPKESSVKMNVSRAITAIVCGSAIVPTTPHVTPRLANVCVTP